MKSNASLFTVSALALLLFTAVLTPSCKKDETCHGKVHCVDSSGVPVGAAVVTLAAPSVNGDVTYTGSTDGSGDVTFEVALPAIFDVTAHKGTLDGVGVLRLDEPGKDNEVTVVMY